MKQQKIILIILLCFLLSVNGVQTPISGDERLPQAETKPDHGNKRIFPLDTYKIIGLVLILLIGGLTNAGGGGGGMLLTSILLLFFQYNENIAVAAVYSMVFGGSLGNFINVVKRRDEKTNKPLIDYDLALLIMPAMVMGTAIGIIFERMAAPVVIVGGIIIATFYSAINVYRNARDQWKIESKEKYGNKGRQGESLLDLTETIDETRFDWREKDEECDTSFETREKVQKILELESRSFPKRKYANLMGLIVAIMIVDVLRGTKKFSSAVGAAYCSADYWGLHAIGIVICAVFSVFNRRWVVRNLELKKNFADPKHTQFELTKKSINELTVIGVVSGILAGLLGIGGGLIIKPKLLNIGVPSQIVAATSGFFVLQTAFVSLFQTMLFQEVPITDQLFFLFLSIAGSFTISYFFSWIIKKKKRPSLILFPLLFVLCVSIIATPTTDILRHKENFAGMIEFKSIC